MFPKKAGHGYTGMPGQNPWPRSLKPFSIRKAVKADRAGKIARIMSMPTG
jgi:hypothetical protein